MGQLLSVLPSIHMALETCGKYQGTMLSAGMGNI